MKTCQPTNVLFESRKIHSLPILYLVETFLTVYAFLWLPASCALYVKVHYISTLRVFDTLTLPLAPPSITIDQIYRAYAAASLFFCQATFYCMGQLLCVPQGVLPCAKHNKGCFLACPVVTYFLAFAVKAHRKSACTHLLTRGDRS